MGSVAVLAPVLAHLFARPRFRRLPFTLLRFLRAGQKDVQARRKLRDLLLLLLRCAIIVLIAMLFAGPRLLARSPGSNARDLYFLGLDNSLSMAYSDGPQSYFQSMLDAAADYIRSAPSGSLFNLYALASGERGANLSSEQALAFLRQLAVVPSVSEPDGFIGALRSAQQRRHPDDRISSLLLSDFTPKMMERLGELSGPVLVDDARYKMISSEGPIHNAAPVDAHVTDLAQGKLHVSATVANYGSVTKPRALEARLGGKKAAAVQVAAAATQNYRLAIPVEGARQAESCLPIELSLSGGDGLREDDTFYLAAILPEESKRQVVLIGSDRRELFLLRTALNSLSLMNAYETVSVKEATFAASHGEALAGADVAVFAGMPDALSDGADEISSFVQNGGRAVFFLTRDLSADALDRLWRADVLPALPRRYHEGATHVAPSNVYTDALSPDGKAIKALCNYKIETILFLGSFDCEQSPAGACLWRLQNGNGFVYFKHHGNGSAVLINTSADDSLGALTRSRAAVAFCRYLLGPSTAPLQNSFASDETIVLALPQSESEDAAQERRLYVMTPSGEPCAAQVSGSTASVQCPHQIGWVKTLTRPASYAGVNPPRGETDMQAPAKEVVADLMGRIFPVAEGKDMAAASRNGLDKDNRPIWRFFAWLIIGLVLFESFVANKVKR